MFDELESVPAQSEVVVHEQPVEEVSQEQPAQETVQKDSPHFAEMRKKIARAERERDELARALEQERIKKSAPVDEDFSLNIGDDEIVEGKHLSKIKKEMRHMEQKMQQYQQQIYQTATEAKLKSEYPDIESIVSRENIEELAVLNPVLARTLDSTPDFYNKAVAYYTVIKGMNIGNSSPQAVQYAQDKRIAQENSIKPRASASLSPQSGDSPLSRANAFANGLTPDLKKEMWREMEAAIKNLN